MSEMDEAAKKPALGRFGNYWLFGVIGVVFFDIAGKWFDTTTELTPSHGDILSLSFLIGILAGIVSAAVGFRQSAQFPVWRRTASAIGFGISGALALFLASDLLATFIENAVDFPSGRTATFETYMRIGRAYHASKSWVIQPEPIWSNIDIAEDDFAFMREHRRPGDLGRDPGEISSKGYFCARVTMQRAGDAIRVMHAGSHALPKGSVVVCPAGKLFGD